ncbi:MAG: hypothetical protein HN352_04715 [Bacteroidetes bacterium]|jgi:hypothetical protein|nr:hypothetical protein [Bacteroidota bacterium]MBT4410945.1 hypothetical protein [Bacteroidota bacterium]
MGHICVGLIVLCVLYILIIIMDEREKVNKIKNAKINNALGVFILFFGFIVIFAMIFADTFVQQMTNLVAGLVLCIIGGGMMLKSRITMRSLK